MVAVNCNENFNDHSYFFRPTINSNVKLAVHQLRPAIKFSHFPHRTIPLVDSIGYVGKILSVSRNLIILIVQICLDGQCISLLDVPINVQSNASTAINGSRIQALMVNSTGTQSSGLTVGTGSIVPGSIGTGSTGAGSIGTGLASIISQVGPPLASAGVSLATQAAAALSAALQSQGGSSVSASGVAPSVQVQVPTGGAVGGSVGTGGGSAGTGGGSDYQHLISQLNSLLAADYEDSDGSVNSAAMADSLSALAAAFA